MNGKVYLVGAGPGDPGLITLKGKACIKKADTIIYDYLASKDLLKYASDSADLIYVGKKGGDHTLSQNEINSLIVEKAKNGSVVTRLKGGDPFIFGRGGEEAEELAKVGIEFEVVPGISSAIAAPAYAGIPLTHRQFTSTLAFVTGHEDPKKSTSSIDWKSLAKGIGTIVFLMGVKNLPNIVDRLIDHGKPPETPVAIVRWGTTARQVTVEGTLDTIVEKVKASGLKPPSIIVVGDVVTLRNSMNWFEKRPLMGKKIIVTRARSQASDLVGILSDLGAECIEFPTIEIFVAENTSPLEEAIDNISRYNWLIFTSVNGVKFFFEKLFEKGLDSRTLGNIRTAAIGPATSARLLDFGIKSDIVPESYRAESIIEAFSKEKINGAEILLPRAGGARPILPIELEKMGAKVHEVISYHAGPVSENADQLIAMLEERSVDLVTFTSSSTVTNFKALLPDDRVEELMEGTDIVSIGPITTETAEKLGFKVTLTAEDYTIPGLCDAIKSYWQKGS
ncbi:MAG: uroporphyrinogen-III C-methyltransferase [Deltaproteobacteria bacterium]|nr:uroporphyrinogen-III C-methyltransferase [Deltaproteobacteria bacterium]